ncbi:MAG: hypothetical protein KJO07_16865, partial [Deltaproteobacteria bacterium]|nr:hypothetical protein [Deltaproteobacteria bacterium]
TAQVGQDGSIDALGDPPAVKPEGLGLRFDLTDAAMRAVDMDPYDSRKRALLDATRGQRLGMAASARSRRLRQSLAVARRNLARLWASRKLSARRRRELIFQLWDECAESGSTEVLATSRSVRATIESFVRRRLPQDSPLGYTPDELDRLNRGRSSEARFSPYR